jgi:hypothetical protein
MQNFWNGKGKNKERELKPMVVERGKTCSRSKEKLISTRKLATEGCISISTIRCGRSPKHHS